jgi:RING-type zinc-finger
MDTGTGVQVVQPPKPEHLSSMPAFVADNSNNNNNGSKSFDARFCCNICLEAVTEPVVTRCGHLYCWPCLYQWLAPGMRPQERSYLGLRRPSSSSSGLLPLDETRRSCPVCKATCSVDTVVPIYVRNTDDAQQQQQPVQQQQHDSPAATTTTTTASNPLLAEERQEAGDDFSDDDNNNNDNTMGLYIDEDFEDEQVMEGIPRTIDVTLPTTPAPVAGLRQRRPNQNTTTEDLSTSMMVVPTRPVFIPDTAPSSPNGRAASPTTARTSNNNGPIENHAARSRLSYQIVLAMHQTLLQATNNHNINNNTNHQQDHQDHIPSLHYRQQRDSSDSTEVIHWEDADPAATVFLSRLLLGLFIFVFSCFLFVC